MQFLECDRIYKRDGAVELARILACLIVIGVHVFPATTVEDAYDFSRNYMSCLLADGVAVFWFVTGFFLFQKFQYSKILLRTLKTVVIPVFVFSLFMIFIFNRFWNGTVSVPLGEWINYGTIKAGFKQLLNWDNPVSGLGHLWFLYVYVLLMIISPVLYGFIGYLNDEPKREYVFLAISFTLLLWNDISGNGMGEFTHHTFRAVIPAAIEVIWGYLIYKNKALLLKKHSGLAWFSLFLVVNLIRCGIQMHRFQSGNMNNSILYWYSCLGLLASVSILGICFSVMKDLWGGTFAEKCIKIFASFTFLIYLLAYHRYYSENRSNR